MLTRVTATGTPQTRLVVLRGNSGSGKSTIARLLREIVPDQAIVSQDVLRRDVLRVPDAADNASIGLIDLVARYALDRGQSVAVEGILHARRYGPMLLQLVADHRGISRTFVLDVPFEETLRRHATKAKAAEFGEDEMRAWWHGLQLVDGLDEAVIGAGLTADEAAGRIARGCGTAPAAGP